MADRLSLDFDQVTLGDIEEFEEYTGKTLGELESLASTRIMEIRGRMLTGLAFLALRQSNPDATWDEAKRLRLVNIAEMFAGDETNPTPAEPEPLRPLRDGSAGPKKRTGS